jgi:hypothetical protein
MREKMTLDQLITQLITIRDSNPELANMAVEMEDQEVGPDVAGPEVGGVQIDRLGNKNVGITLLIA